MKEHCLDGVYVPDKYTKCENGALQVSGISSVREDGLGPGRLKSYSSPEHLLYVHQQGQD